MRIGVIWEPGHAATHYRAVSPAQALERRGHQLVWDPGGLPEVSQLLECDVVFAYRRGDDVTVDVATAVVAAGIPLVYDNDDDYTHLVHGHAGFGYVTEEHGRRTFERTLAMATRATTLLVTSPALAAVYREAGIERVEVVPNYLLVGAVGPPVAHEGLVVGWVAASEHLFDAEELGIPDVLEELVYRHGDVRVECIGIDVGLSRSYEHTKHVPFADLSHRIAGWDIGLAPLVDVPFNRARSDIKVKEYAARGVPWLASPVGPYEALGEEHGGRLVDDGAWLAALDRLVRKGRERRRLSKAAEQWARTQTIQAAAERYERIMRHAVEDGPRRPVADRA